MTNNFEIDLSLTYNNFIYQLSRDNKSVDSYWMREDLNQGVGYYLEGNYYLNNNWGVGLGLDYSSSIWLFEEEYWQGVSHNKYKCELIGGYINLIYNLKNDIQLKTNIINYSYSESFFKDYSWDKKDFNEDLDQGKGLGVIIGLDMDYSITNNLSIKFNSGYRRALINFTEEYSDGKMITNRDNEKLSITGLRISSGISYQF